jgi:hypothetical protein
MTGNTGRKEFANLMRIEVDFETYKEMDFIRVYVCSEIVLMICIFASSVSLLDVG